MITPADRANDLGIIGSPLTTLTKTPVINTDTSMSFSIGQISAALSKAQGEMGAAKKDQDGYGYSYSDLAQVIASSKEALSNNELSVVQLVGSTEKDSVSLTTILSHSSGEYFKTTSTLPLIDMKGTNKAQDAGASLSYLRRYAYQAIIGQPSEDNDASSNGFKSTAKPKKAAAKPAASKPATGKKSSFRKNKNTTPDGGVEAAAPEGTEDDL